MRDSCLAASFLSFRPKFTIVGGARLHVEPKRKKRINLKGKTLELSFATKNDHTSRCYNM